MQALEAIANGDSQRRASRECGVPRSTLKDRLNSHVSRQEAAAPLQKLSPVQEQRLTSWILVQESLGLSPIYTQIKDFAQRLLAIRGDMTTIGKQWIQGFLKRNPILKTKK